MNSNLFKAIYTLYSTSNTFKAATFGRFEYGVAPENWSDNFATIQATGANKADTFRTAVDDVYFQINVFSTSRANCWDMLDKCITLFDGSILTITGYYPSRVSRENQIPPIWNEQDNLYQATAEFTARTQKT